MAGSKSLASINIRFHADLEQFKTQMQKAQSSMKEYGKKMTSMGKTMSMSVTAPLAALGTLAVMNFNKQAQAIAQVEQGLRSTGNQVGFTSQELQKMASDLQNNSLFGDEVILRDATAQLLTFTNIAGEQFSRTQLAAMDLATRLNGDLKSASIQLGKALNDPVANLSALSRSGIQFSAEQKTVINEMAKTNRLAEAQTLILDELERQYGGSAAAAAAVGTGGIKQLSNSFGDLLEEFGAIITEGIQPLIEFFKKLVQAFQNTSPEVKKLVTIVAVLAATAGPLVLTLGLVATAMSAITTTTLVTIATISGILLALGLLAAAAAYVYSNWDVFAHNFKALWHDVKRMTVEDMAFIVSVMDKGFRGMGNYSLSNISVALDVMAKDMGSGKYDYGFKAFGASMNDVFNELMANGGGVSNAIEQIKSGFAGSVPGIDAATTSLNAAADAMDRIGGEKTVELKQKGAGLNPDFGSPGEIKRESPSELLQSQLQGYADIQAAIEETMLAEQARQDVLNATKNVLTDAGRVMADSFEAMFNGEQGDPFQALVGYLKNLAIRLLATAAAAAILLPFLGGLGIAGGATSAAAIGTSFKDIFSAIGGLNFFADGGIVTRPTLSVTGEAGPEAIIPLGKLGQIMGNSGGGFMRVGGSFELSGYTAMALVERQQYLRSR
jgi:hypothetical protein